FISNHWYGRWGQVTSSSSGKGAITGGPSLSDVESRARKNCEKNSGGDCKIAMSTCSDPIFKKF
ncbi:DUF4189 domain-containing protein, partial [Xanthomonas campestris]|uniref:DUF4189 domain-containing protein n=1 Tax=Xanthomonas campestris TaxID=339 RepID=UPI0011AEFC35